MIPKVIQWMHLLLVLLVVVLATAGMTLALNLQPTAALAAEADEDDDIQGQFFAYVTKQGFNSVSAIDT